jgi:acyl-CoA thioesterase
MSFTAHTAVTAGGDGYHGEIHDGWDVGGAANGGYLMAIAARAMAAASRPHPVSLTAHFLAPGRPGPVTIRPEIVKTGKRFCTVRAALTGVDRTLVELLGSFGDLTELDGPTRVDAAPPDLPPPDDCVPIRPDPAGFPPPMMGRVDLRLHPEDARFAAGRPSGSPLFRGWIRPAEEAFEPLFLLMAVDAFPPTVFNANLPIAWTPTVELTAHMRAVPRPGWLRCRFSTRFISDSLLEEDGEIWDESDRLVAQSRQLALAPRP